MTPHPHRQLVPLPPVWASLAVALLFATWTWNLYGVDMDAFLLPWFAHIRQAGVIGAFATPFSNYTPPYLYLLAAVSPLAALLPPFVVIKLLSYGGHLLLAVAMRRLFAAAGHERPARAAALVALAPTLFVSPAIMSQCDAFWASALVMAVTAAIQRRHGAMFAWCGVAVAFKLQAAFAGPFILALALSRYVPLRLWLLTPLAYGAMMLPAWLAGWPAGDLATIYLRQAAWEDALALSAPNIWMIVQSSPVPSPAALGQAATAAALLAVASYVLFFARRLGGDDPIISLRAACLCALVVPGLLPRMHERYFFLSDVLALAIVLLRPAEWRIGLLTQLGSALAILAYLSGASELAVIGAAAMIMATWMLARPLFASAPRPVPAAA